HRGRDGVAAEPEVGVGGDERERLGREPELVDRAPYREVGLVRRVDADALKRPPTRRARSAEEATEVDVAGERHADEVRHRPARGQDPEALRPEPDEVAEPANDVLLDEGS